MIGGLLTKRGTSPHHTEISRERHSSWHQTKDQDKHFAIFQAIVTHPVSKVVTLMRNASLCCVSTPKPFTDLKMSHSPSIPIPVPLLYPFPAEDELNAFVGLPLHHPLPQPSSTSPLPAQIAIPCSLQSPRSPSSPQMASLLYEILSMEGAGDLTLNGYYSHAGHSYDGNSPDDAMSMLKLEIDVCKADASRAPAHAFKEKRVVFSVGASPTTLSVQNLQSGKVSSNAARSLQEAMHLDQASFELELHAGVYPLLDMQQIATRARHFDGDPHDAIALTILAEVRSLYPERERPEALVAAGTVALGREPCKNYRGWGVVTPWRFEEGEDVGDRLVVSRISQEHGISAFEHNSHRNLSLRIGQKIRIWPNHACIASSGYGWYLVVDSKSESPDEVKEVWPRWRGW
jgi:D-serine deaminase-like pyridoxal phosphate-dependent protein